VDTDGNSVENPRFAKKSTDKLAKAQKRLARAERGSNNRRKIKEQIEAIPKRINNQRDDLLHKLSRLYVNNYDNICIEDLDVKGLKKKATTKGCIAISMMRPGPNLRSCFRTRLRVLVES